MTLGSLSSLTQVSRDEPYFAYCLQRSRQGSRQVVFLEYGSKSRKIDSLTGMPSSLLPLETDTEEYRLKSTLCVLD